MTEDVPSPIDFRSLSEAREWEVTAMVKRPWRTDFFALFASAIETGTLRVERILDLGSGPGFLAEYLLTAFPAVGYVAVDFSAAMHQLALERLGPLGARVQFVERSLRDPEWTKGLGQFECAVTIQAVHELRHKRHARVLHEQVRSLLVPGGQYLVCDHFAGEGGMQNDQLYMTMDEQRITLADAGFVGISPLLIKGGLVLHRALREGG